MLLNKQFAGLTMQIESFFDVTVTVLLSVLIAAVMLALKNNHSPAKCTVLVLTTIYTSICIRHILRPSELTPKLVVVSVALYVFGLAVLVVPATMLLLKYLQ